MKNVRSKISSFDSHPFKKLLACTSDDDSSDDEDSDEPHAKPTKNEIKRISIIPKRWPTLSVLHHGLLDSVAQCHFMMFGTHFSIFICFPKCNHFKEESLCPVIEYAC